jgi:hypothetical protein
MTQKFSSNSDLFNFISKLIGDLRNVDENKWASEFQEAMSISFMPGEILGALRLTLLKFQKTRVPKKMKLDIDIREAIKSLDNVLGYWRPNGL